MPPSCHQVNLAQFCTVFVYGGRFISGEKVLSAIPVDVAYSNVGHFIAENFGFEYEGDGLLPHPT